MARTLPNLPLVAAAVCAAIVLVHRLPMLPGPAWFVPGSLLALLALGRRSTRWTIVVFAAVAWTVWCAERRLAERLPDELTGQDFGVVGWVDNFPTGPVARRTFSFVVEHSEHPAVPRRLRLGWYGAPDVLAAGEALSLTVRLRAPRGLANPGGFDYEQWLLVQGYGATGYVRRGEPLTEPPQRLARSWLLLRRAAAERVEQVSSNAEAAALLVALTVGERYGFSDGHWGDLRRTGTSHLVAISGMHVGFIAMLAFVTVRRLWLLMPFKVVHRDLEVAAAASALAAISYALLAGLSLPTQRAVIMLLVVLVWVVGRRAIGWGNGLAIALLVVLFADPFAVLSVSFWLSYGAVALLLVIASRRDIGARSARRVERFARGALTLGALQLTMSFGLVPITALYFGEVSLISPLANLIAIPYFNIVLVPVALTALVAAATQVPGKEMIVDTAVWLANAAWAGVAAMAKLDWAAMPLPYPSVGVALLAATGVVLGMQAHPLPARLLAWCALLPLVAPPAARPAAGTAQVMVLDVGHGLAVIVETAQRLVLYDAGPSFPSGFDTGEQIAVPALRGLGRRGLDLLIVSHADNDHSGGAPAVLDAYPTAQVLKGPDVADLPGGPCVAGQQWVWDGVEFEMLHPREGFRPLGNDSSCVLKVTAAGGSMLVLGDVERRGEREVADHPRVAADVVIVGHHGSATSSTWPLVQATEARYALVSAGYRNRWDFPRAEVVERWESIGARIYSTGEAGALQVTLGTDGIELTTERERQRRYWRAR